MQEQKYGGLDLFRPAAALLVLAIHTSPLASFSSDADFFLTRILARIAVPFFFMVTGQFILSSGASVLRYVKKLCIIYLAAILLYLPLGIYAGHYRELTPTGVFKMLFFDGTFYHLWYFPACILGLLLVTLFGRFLRPGWVAAFSAVLYVMGLLGDSYFGLTAKIPLLSHCYHAMFRVFSYTRNGLFFAPLFLVLGALAGSRPTADIDNKGHGLLRCPTPWQKALALTLSFAAMTAEAFTLRNLGFQRHDSMYLFLVPVAYFLYQCLLSVPAVSRKSLRSAATWIYLLHPAMIAVVRGVARPLRLTELLVENSLIHFTAVACLSVISSVLLVRTLFSANCDTNVSLPSPGTERAWIELDMHALEHNVQFLRSGLPKGCRLMPAVKANAYGHGAVPVARKLNRLGIRDFCVACVEEGVELRRAGICGEILILGYTSPSLFPLLRRYRLTQTVVDYDYAQRLEQSGLKISVHIGVDTGMHRLGIPWEETEKIIAVYHMKHLKVKGIFTHLATCDSLLPECRAFTEKQLQAFSETRSALDAAGLPCKGVHLLSSYGILNYPQAAEDYVRPGIALYGVPSSAGLSDSGFSSLMPVLSLKARVASVRRLHPGESAGYGAAFTADGETIVAVLSIGYADGLPRELSEQKGSVLIKGRRAPVIGRICMDQTLVDVTDIPDLQAGETAVLIGKSGSLENTAVGIAAQCGTITNELLSRLGARLHRVKA